jgi:hypothetical protein
MRDAEQDWIRERGGEVALEIQSCTTGVTFLFINV